MGFIFQFFLFMFLVAVAILLIAGFKVWRFYRRMKKAAAGFGSGSSYGDKRGRRQRSSVRRYRRIIPPEYAVDVDYEVLGRTGSEQFVIIQEVLSYKGESQISDAVYTVIIS